MITNSFFSSKLTASELAKVTEVCTKLNIENDWLCAVMYLESYLKPHAKNRISGSVGLIQFTRDKAGINYKTINGKKYDLDSIQKMGFIQQMDLVYLYFKNYTMYSFQDVYLVTFFPAGVGKSQDFVFQTKNLPASLIATQNPSFDTNKDKKITKQEFTLAIEKKYKSLTGSEVKKKV